MSYADLEQSIEKAWEARETINSATQGEMREAVEAALAALDSGQARVAEQGADGWVVNQWLKKAVLLSFRLNDLAMISGAPGGVWLRVTSRKPASVQFQVRSSATRLTSRRALS